MGVLIRLKMWFTSLTKRRVSASRPRNGTAWTPLMVLIGVSLIATVYLSMGDVVGLAIRCVEVDSIHDPERARLELSPWLPRLIRRADNARSTVPDGVAVLVSGRARFFVAYRLLPKACFADDRQIAVRLQEEGVPFVRIDDLGHAGPVQVPGGLDAARLFFDDFENGHPDDWSGGTTSPSGARR